MGVFDGEGGFPDPTEAVQGADRDRALVGELLVELVEQVGSAGEVGQPWGDVPHVRPAAGERRADLHRPPVRRERWCVAWFRPATGDRASAAARSSSARACPSGSANRSVETTWASSPGRSQSATRVTRSLRAAPDGSAAHAACHSAWP